MVKQTNKTPASGYCADELRCSCGQQGSSPGSLRKPPRWPPGLCPCPHSLPHPGARSGSDSSSVKVKPHPSSAQTPCRAHAHQEQQPKFRRSQHSPTPNNSQDSRPPVQLFLLQPQGHLVLPQPLLRGLCTCYSPGLKGSSQQTQGSLPPRLQFLGQKSPSW